MVREGVGGIVDMDYWRDYFGGAPSDIFGVIEKAILVAAADRPEEFLTRRDGIAETLFSCRSTARCLGCDRLEVRVPCRGEEREGQGSKRRGEDEGTPGDGAITDAFAGKSSNVNSSCEDDGPAGAGGQMVSNYSYDEAEALTEEIEEETQIVAEVFRLKDVLFDYEEKSESVLFESLRRLQLMALSVETLQATEIGKAVNGLRKHKSKPIRHLARTLIESWKILVDEWVNSTAVLQEATPESANPTTNYDDEDDDDDGLPLPPLDEGAFLATQTTTMELSQFFDGMDDDGNPQNIAELNRNVEKGKKPMSENNCQMRKAPPSAAEEYRPPARVIEMGNRDTRQPQEQNKAKIQSNRLEMAQNYLQKQSKGHNGNESNSGMMRPSLNQSRDQRGYRDPRSLPQTVRTEAQRRLTSGLQDKSNGSAEGSVQAKLEIAKRKLHEGYQQAETAKRQRTIQVMELHDLPKQAPNPRPPHPKAVGHNRHWANGRR